MTMRFGIFDHVDDAGVPAAQQFAERLALGELCDRLGFYGYHVAEHHGTRLGLAPSPNVLLAAMSVRTTRMRLGALVSCVPIYHPVRLLEELCMLDQLSDGRALWGVGRGVSPLEMGFYTDLKLEDTRGLFEEALELMRAGFTSEVLDHAGEHFTVTDMPMALHPVQRPHPPLWFGIVGTDRVPWAVQRDVNVVSLANSDGIRPITDAYRAEWAAQGRAPEDLPLLGASRNVVVADTAEEADRIARRAFARWREALGWLWVRVLGTDPWDDIAPGDYDDWVAAGRIYAGAPDGVAEWVSALEQEAGVTYLAAQMIFGDITFAEASRSIELFAGEVMPVRAEVAADA